MFRPTCFPLHSGPMRISTSQVIGTLALMICLVCPILELIDTWDPPIQPGNDTEYSLAIAAVCAGAAYLFACAILAFHCQNFVEGRKLPFGSLGVFISARYFDFSCTDTSPPSVPLRI